MKLSNKTVLITGGSSGIGLALAEAFIGKGSKVIVCGRDTNKLRQAEIRLPSVTAVKCDITDPEDLNRLRTRIEARFPKFDLLVNNAGIQSTMDFRTGNIDDAAIERELQTNLAAQIKITNLLYPLLSARPESAIVFIGSALGHVPKFSVPVYSAAKAGLHCFAQCLRQQLESSPTRIVEVIPDLVDTPMTGDRDNARKIQPARLARLVTGGLEQERERILVGRTGILLGINRFLPALAQDLVNGRRRATTSGINEIGDSGDGPRFSRH